MVNFDAECGIDEVFVVFREMSKKSLDFAHF